MIKVRNARQDLDKYKDMIQSIVNTLDNVKLGEMKKIQMATEIIIHKDDIIEILKRSPD